ncbi:hypothetical protein BH11PLA2_BH11PLA2_21290 [soil metagenome]
MPKITREMLRDYLNDALPDAELTAIETALRDTPAVQTLLLSVREEIDRGEHSIGGIWRRERLSCPTRDQLGSHLLKALDDDLFDYIEFHLKTIGCPACQANHDDLAKKHAAAEAPAKRRQKIVKSTSGALKKAGKK